MRPRLRALLPRLHLLPALSGWLTVLERARLQDGDLVVDVGAGTGLMTSAAVERVGPDGEVFAVDMSVDALEELRRIATAANVFYLLGSTEVLPLPNESVDVVVARSVPIDSATAAREFYRVLRHGGRVSISDVGPHFDEDDVERLFLEAGFSGVNRELRPDGKLYLAASKP